MTRKEERMKIWYLAIIVATGATFGAIVFGTFFWITSLTPTTLPASTSSSSPESTIIDTRTETFAKFDAENDKWLDERNRFAEGCYTRGGVPVFTLGSRVFCVKNSALVDEPGGIGEPHRPAPKYPK